MKLCLKHIREQGTATHGLDKPVFLIGASAEADLCLPHAAIGEIAVKIERHPDQPPSHLIVENISKDKKVRHNGVAFHRAPLAPGDWITLDGQSLVVDHWEEPQTAENSRDDGLLLRLWRSLSEKITRGKNLEVLLEELLRLSSESLGATESFLFTLDSAGKPRKFQAYGKHRAQDPFSDTIVQQILSTRKGVAVPNALEDPRYSQSQSIADLKIATVVCAPIELAGRLTGMIYLGSRDPLISYQHKDLELLTNIGIIAGMLIDNLTLITSQQEALSALSSRQDHGFIGEAPTIRQLLQRTRTVAPSEISIFIEGETGTGKEVLAQYIHQHSLRASQKFVAVNCSSFRGELLESELFGYKKGAFTGAVTDRPGLFQSAHEGTLFLDELGEMNLNLQAKMLRALETGRVRPVGSVEEEAVDVRILAASNRNLEQMVRDKAFREDLYYRIAQVTLYIPPLRERGDDVRLLAYHFLNTYKAQYPHLKVADFHPKALEAMLYYEWPGNVRELGNVVHRSLLMSASPLVSLDLRPSEDKFENLEAASQKFQMTYITRALALCEGNKEKAAKLLEISRSSLFRYLSKSQTKEVQP